jgi:hypothetical protein
VAAARAACCCLLVLLAVGCGSGGHPRRDAVNAYLAQVKRAQAPLIGGQGQIDLTLQAFSLTKTPANELQKLRRDRTTVARTVRRLQVLEPPPDARHLHALIMQRSRLQVALFDSLIETLRDLSRLRAVGRPLTAAAHRLSTDLATAGGTRVKGGSKAFLQRYAVAFGRYGDTLRPIGAGLAPAEGGSLLRPTIAAERSLIARSTSLCDTIRSTLAKNDIDGANAAIHELLTITQTAGGTSVRAAQQSAARAYNAQVAKIDRLAASIAGERAKLVQRVG